MRNKKHFLILAFALMLLIPQSLRSQSNYEYIHSPGTDVYFGYITYPEAKHDGNDPVVIREGEQRPQVAELNFPLLPGDIIRTTGSRRCEIQLDTGTIIRLDLNTELKIETIMAKSLSSRNKVTNFLLNKGEVYIMYKRYNYPEIFQVITPNASAKLSHSTVALIGAKEDGRTDIQVKRGKALVLYGPDAEKLDKATVNKSMGLMISEDHKAIPGEYEQNVDFELWNDSINKDFQALHDGMSVIPKPIHRFSRAVVYFAQKYSTSCGEWLWDDFYGYVWRTDFNDHYPGGAWQPYYYGQWREVNGQLFWVPMESWGWVPHHLGLWVWKKNRGWLWIPGSAFAPAWVSFHTWGDYCSWRPWSFYDWYLGGAYHRYPYFYLFNPEWPGSPLGPGWDNLLRDEEEGGIIYSRMTRNQAQKASSSAYPLPRAYKGMLKKVVSALESGDERILTPLQRVGEHTVVVKNGDLNKTKVHKRAISPPELPAEVQKKSLSSGTLKNSLREGARIYRRDELTSPSGKTTNKTPKMQKNKEGNRVAEAGSSVTLSRNSVASEKTRKLASDLREGRIHYAVVVPISESLGSSRKLKQTIAHTRDWNPDAGVARMTGVSLTYSSKTNEIRCPELGLSSKTVRRTRNLATMTGLSSSRTGGYYSNPRISYSPRSVSSSSTGSISSSGSSSSNAGSSGGSSKSAGSSRGGSKKK